MNCEWTIKTWGELATLEYGRALSGYRAGSGKYRVFGTNGPIGWTERALYPGPSVIIGRKGAYRGVHFSPEPFWAIDTAFYLKPKLSFNMKWAYYALLAQDINSLDSGSAIPSTSRSDFYALSVKVPPINEQRRIADVLGLLDARRETLVAENGTLESIAQAVFKSWFIDFDPVHAKAAGAQPEGMDAETAALFPSGFEDSELGSIPKGWAIDTIGNVIDTVSGTTPSTRNPEFWQPDEYWWATPKDLSGLSSPVLIKTERRISEAGLARISSGLLPKGTLLMSSRAPIGYLAIAQVPTAINQGFIGMLPGETLTPEYMLFWCRLNMETIVQHANGSTFLEISRSSFRRIQIVVPSAPLVSKFTEIAALLLQRIAENERYVRTLAELRDTLLPRLVSGKLRIPEAKELVEEAVS